MSQYLRLGVPRSKPWHKDWDTSNLFGGKPRKPKCGVQVMRQGRKIAQNMLTGRLLLWAPVAQSHWGPLRDRGEHSSERSSFKSEEAWSRTVYLEVLCMIRWGLSPGSLNTPALSREDWAHSCSWRNPSGHHVGCKKPSVSSRMVNGRAHELGTDSVCYLQFPHPMDRVDMNIAQKDIINVQELWKQQVRRK